MRIPSRAFASVVAMTVFGAIPAGPARSETQVKPLHAPVAPALALDLHDLATVRKALNLPVTPQDHGAKADNAADDSAAIQTAINTAQSEGRSLAIPRGTYAIGARLVITAPIDIYADAGASFRFTNPSSSGILLDFRKSVNGGVGGLVRIQLPALYSSGVDSRLNYPGYPASWSTSGRSGNGVTLWAGSRYTVFVPYMLGWANDVLFQATNSGPNGGQAPQNIDFTLNTADLSTGGIVFDSGPAAAGQITAINVVVNTLFAKVPVHFITTNGSTSAIIQSSVRITGQAFTEEAGGSCVYLQGTKLNTSKIDINWCWAGYNSDAPLGTAASLVLPYIAGDQASHGTSTDGNLALGYFGGSYNEIDVGSAAPTLAGYGSSYATAGQAIRVKDVGENNRIRIKYLDQPPNVAVALSTMRGEAHYNGGIGGAALSKRVYVSASVPTLAPGAIATFWLYHALLSAGTVRSIAIEPLDTRLQLSGLSYGAGDNTAANNREIEIKFKNLTGSAISGATYHFWVEVLN